MLRTRQLKHHCLILAAGTAALAQLSLCAHDAEPIEFSEIGIPYSWGVELDSHESVEVGPAHVGAWSWDEDSFPATARGWTHTSAWVKLDLTEGAALTLTLQSAANVPWPSPEEPNRLAGTNLFPSFTLYRGWDTDPGITQDETGATIDQNHNFNNRGNIDWAEDVTYLDHLENATAHSVTRTWRLPVGHYTINLGGNSPVTLAEGRQGYKATLSAAPLSTVLTNAELHSIDFSEVGIPYAWGLVMDEQSTAQTPPDHVGAWSWDEDGFPETAKGWTHTSSWVKLRLLKPSKLTLQLASLANVPWPSPEEPNRVAGTNLFPSFSLYAGWDTDKGLMTDTNGVSIDQNHNFNNRGAIDWAEDVLYLDHLDNSSAHSATRTWTLPAGDYTINLGGNSPAVVAEGRQGYQATFTTTPLSAPDAAILPVLFSETGVPYAWNLVMNSTATVETPPAHVGAWSWDEDSFPETAKGWTHTSAWVKLDLLQSARFTLTLANRADVPWPSNEDPNRLAGTNLFPSFTLYRGWDTDAGLTTDTNGVTIDQNHNFNNRGAIDWAEDVAYVDHLDNSSAHAVARTWTLAAGRYTINLGGNSPATLAEGRQGYKATFTTTPVTTLASGSATIDWDKAAWDTLASGFGTLPVLTLAAFFNQADANALASDQLVTNAQANPSYTGQVYAMNGPVVTNLAGRTAQPSTFAYEPGNLTHHAGSIGLGGAARFAVLGGAGGNLLYGDYTLQYDSARLVFGGSGWYLKGNIPPAGAVFDLLNVQIKEATNSFTLAGDLGVSFEVANLLYATANDALRDVGNFTFTGQVRTLEAPVISQVALAGANLIVRGSNGLPGASYALLSSGSIGLPRSAWTTSAVGVFDAEGKCSISLPISAAATARFFNLQQP